MPADWHYWGSEGWGPHWDPAVYPDPGQMVDELHGLNYTFMVREWGLVDPLGLVDSLGLVDPLGPVDLLGHDRL